MSASGGGAAVGGNADIRAEGAGSIAALQTGDIHQHHHVHLPAREPVVWPRMVGLIPPLAGAFQDRAERSRLRGAAAGGGTVVLCQVLTGMGGVGKTQLAADFAEEAWANGCGVDLLVWVTASSRDAVVAAFAGAAVVVCGADWSDPGQAAQDFLAWLRSTGRRWLVVLDDVADPADVAGLWPPAVAHGRTVVTTRRRDAALIRGRRALEVGVFTSSEAVAYLVSVLAEGGRVEPSDVLAGLAEDLGCLPLALSQAAAYVLDAGIGVGEYRELLRRTGRSLAEISPDSLPDDQTRTMAAAWELSLDYADRLRPAGLARPMLQLVAFLAPNSTPMTVLTSRPALDYLTAHRTPFLTGPRVGAVAGPGEPVTPQDAVGALRALHRLSLLTAPGPAPVSGDGDAGAAGEVSWDGRVVRVHQIVQRATRDALTPDPYRNTARSAADALVAAWPEVERDSGLVQALRACTTALVTCTEEGAQHNECLYRPEAHEVLYWFGNSLGGSGQVSAALHHFQQLSETTGHHLGRDHPDTLTARGTLAYWLGEAGDAAGAAAAFAELVDDEVRVLGPDHPDTLSARGNLARWRGEAGDAAGAAVAFAELVDVMVRALGPDHRHTLSARGNLARWRGEAGDVTGAVAAYAELVDDEVRALGPDHPNTFTTRHNLAHVRGEAGDATGAAIAFAELVDDEVRVLGPDHPETLISRGSLARWRGESGDATGAAIAFAELLDDAMRTLGPDHPTTLTIRHNLARWRGEAGDATGAAIAFAELLEDRSRVLGPDHPRTLTTRNDLAYWRGQAAKKDA